MQILPPIVPRMYALAGVASEVLPLIGWAAERRPVMSELALRGTACSKGYMLASPKIFAAVRWTRPLIRTNAAPCASAVRGSSDQRADFSQGIRCPLTGWVARRPDPDSSSAAKKSDEGALQTERSRLCIGSGPRPYAGFSCRYSTLCPRWPDPSDKQMD